MFSWSSFLCDVLFQILWWLVEVRCCSVVFVSKHHRKKDKDVRIINWCIRPTLAIFQLYREVSVRIKKLQEQREPVCTVVVVVVLDLSFVRLTCELSVRPKVRLKIHCIWWYLNLKCERSKCEVTWISTNLGYKFLVRDSSAVRRLFRLAGAVGRQRALYKKNSGFVGPTLDLHISTFCGYQILFSTRNPNINRFTNHFSIHS